jgi:phosphonate transport system permease protein
MSAGAAATDAGAAGPGPPQGKRRAFAVNWWGRAAWLAFAVYCVYALSLLDLTWARFERGLVQAGRMIGRALPPEYRWEKMELLLKGMAESLEIAVIASAVGLVLSLPIGILAARNLMPPFVSWPARAVIAVCRSFHPVIVAIMFVKVVGFGALAGILALIVASVGFVGKLFAEAIEEISPKQVEAVRATGAAFPNIFLYAVMPQVAARFIGFASYELDSNLRNSTMVGIVGAGGIGGTLFAAFQRFDYDFVLTIVLAIIAVIMLGEIVTGRLRRTFQ